MSIIRRIQRLYEPNTDPDYARIDVKVDQLTILDPDVTEKELASADTYVEPKREGSLLEGYDYFKIGDVHIDHFDKTKDQIPETEEPSLLQTDEPEQMETGTLDMRDDGEVNYVPSGVVDYLGESIQKLKLYPSSYPDYYNECVQLTEAAMKAKQRNALDDNQFGLPRTRSYPLNDAKHIKAAIRMFHYCKDPEDQKTLAHNIFKAMRSKGVDMKIGESNPLYKYAPEDLREAAYPKFNAYMVDKPMDKRTKEDIVKEHLRVNADYYNNAFYGTEYASMIEELNDMDFLDVFYPNLRSMSFANRQLTVIGGLMAKDARGYRADKNWFKVDLSKDQNHIEYCKKLYPILGKMLLDPVWDPRTLTPYEMGVILDWYQRISYHYGCYKDADSEADKLRETQYLWDLYWNYNENPDDPHIKAVNVIALVSQMRAIDAKGKAIHINEDQILGRQQLREYLAKELGDNTEIYLLPDTKEYPIIDQASVQLAMDKINTVPKDKRRIFAKNLNRRYRELGCDFSISADHPYARYADQKILDRMANVLMEDNSLPIDDQSHALDDKAAREGRPYYRRSDVEPGSNWHNILDNKEMGPNNLKQQRPDYQGGEALL